MPRSVSGSSAAEIPQDSSAHVGAAKQGRMRSGEKVGMLTKLNTAVRTNKMVNAAAKIVTGLTTTGSIFFAAVAITALATLPFSAVAVGVLVGTSVTLLATVMIAKRIFGKPLVIPPHLRMEHPQPHKNQKTLKKELAAQKAEREATKAANEKKLTAQEQKDKIFRKFSACSDHEVRRVVKDILPHMGITLPGNTPTPLDLKKLHNAIKSLSANMSGLKVGQDTPARKLLGELKTIEHNGQPEAEQMQAMLDAIQKAL